MDPIAASWIGTSWLLAVSAVTGTAIGAIGPLTTGAGLKRVQYTPPAMAKARIRSRKGENRRRRCVREARGCSADVRRATISSEKSARSSAAMASRIKRQPYTTTGQTTDYRLGFSQIISIAWTYGKNAQVRPPARIAKIYRMQ